MTFHRPGTLTSLVLTCLLALAACGPNPDGTGADSAQACASGRLLASGSSAQGTAMTTWTAAYGARCDATVEYTANGSGAGIADFLAGKTSLAGSDSALKKDEQGQADARCKGGRAIHLPMVATAVGITFNLNGLPKLTLTPAVIARIFQGQITRWNDSELAAANRGAVLPATAITVVYRSRPSGTTDNFTRFLAAQTPGTWKLGTGKTWNGAVGKGATDSAAAVAEVKGTDGAISYVDAPDAMKNDLKLAAVDTGRGAVDISDDSVGNAIEAAEQVSDGRNLTLKLDYGLKRRGVYPAVLVTYEITCEKGLPVDQHRLVKSLLTYPRATRGRPPWPPSATPSSRPRCWTRFGPRWPPSAERPWRQFLRQRRFVVARQDFHSQVAAVRGALVDMTGTAATAMGRATVALLGSNLEAAREVAALDTRLDAARRAVEDQTYELLALQQPVAGDLRGLVSAIRIGGDIDRMGSLAHHVAKIAARRHPVCAVPDELLPLFGRMAEVAGRMAAGAGAVLAANDAEDAARLDVDDDAMDGLRRALFGELLEGWPHGVEAAIDAVLLGRYYERFADHAVSIAGTVVYLVTGTLPDERLA